MTTQELAQMMAALHGAYRTWDIDEATIGVWRSAFQGASYITSMQAVEQWISHSAWPPTIAELQEVKRRILEREAMERPALGSGTYAINTEQAKEAFSAGYRQQRARLGDDNELIQRKLDVYLRKFPGSIPGMGS